MATHELEDYDEVILRALAKLPPERLLKVYPPEQWLVGLTPEQRVAGLTPGQRVAGLSLEQLLLLQSDETLRALSDTCFDTLSPEARAAIRARIGR